MDSFFGLKKRIRMYSLADKKRWWMHAWKVWGLNQKRANRLSFPSIHYLLDWLIDWLTNGTNKKESKAITNCRYAQCGFPNKKTGKKGRNTLCIVLLMGGQNNGLTFWLGALSHSPQKLESSCTPFFPRTMLLPLKRRRKCMLAPARLNGAAVPERTNPNLRVLESLDGRFWTP